MDRREYLRPADFVMKKIRSRDKVVYVSVFVFMVLMLPVIQTLSLVDGLILNLMHSVDQFFTLKDWKKSSKDLFFGSMYLLATRVENVGVTLLCGTGVALVWTAACRSDVDPLIRWIFDPSLFIFGFSFFIQWAPGAIVSLVVFKTACKFMFNYPNKTLQDILLVFSYIFLHLVFAEEDYSIHYLALSYASSFAWMFLNISNK